mgnify:FL=1
MRLVRQHLIIHYQNNIPSLLVLIMDLMVFPLLVSQAVVVDTELVDQVMKYITMQN